jgi:hypothetical protein
MHTPPTHLPSQYAKSVHVTSRRGSSVGQSKALRVDQLWGSSVGEPIDLYPRGGGRNGGRSKAGNADTSVGAYEDTGLDKRERVIPGMVEDGRTILIFPWTISRLCKYFTARAIPKI